MAPRHAQNVVTGCTPRFTGKANVLKRTVTGRQKLRNCRTMKNLQTDKFPAPPLRAKGILTFDVEDKIKALFEEREWLSGIGVRSVPMMSDTDVRKTLDIKPKERLEHFLEKLMDTKNMHPLSELQSLFLCV